MSYSFPYVELVASTSSTFHLLPFTLASTMLLPFRLIYLCCLGGWIRMSFTVSICWLISAFGLGNSMYINLQFWRGSIHRNILFMVAFYLLNRHGVCTWILNYLPQSTTINPSLEITDIICQSRDINKTMDVAKSLATHLPRLILHLL